MRAILILLILLPVLSFAQLNTYAVEELDSLQYTEARPVLFFINTDWCSICLAMENKVLKSKEISSILNQRFYTVILNAEYKEDIIYKGKRYQYRSHGINSGKHELAMQIAMKDGGVAFPSLAIIDGNKVMYKVNGFVGESELKRILELWH